MPGATLGYLKFVLGFDTIAFKKGMTGAEKDLVKFQKKVDKLGQKIGDIGKVMTLGLTAPLVAFGAASFKAASDANELQSAFNVTFGAMAGDMSKWAEATGNAMGRATTTIMEAANTFGIFFNTAVDPKKAAAMSKQFAVLAQDLGSFFNVDPTEAMDKLRAGLSGEAEPLRKFGVFLNEAAVAAKGVELGLIKVGGKMTDQQKIVARANLILEATVKAQGDVARTSDSTANQLVRSKEAWKELSIVVGTKLLPVLTPFVEKLGDALDALTKLDPETQKWAGGLVLALGAAGPLLMVLGPLTSALAKCAPLMLAFGRNSALAAPGIAAAEVAAAPLGIALGVIAGALLIAYGAWKNWDKLKPILDDVALGMKEIEGTAVRIGGEATWGEKFGQQLGHIKAQFTGLQTDLDKLDAWAKQFDVNFVASVNETWKSFETWWADMKKLAKSFGDDVWKVITDSFDRTVAPIKRTAQAIKNTFSWLEHTLVGGSIVPDMVDDIGREMAKLETLMSEPVERAAVRTAKTAKARAAQEKAEALRRRKDAQKNAQDLASDTKSILDRLFPKDARYQQYLADLGTLSAKYGTAAENAGLLAAATAALNKEFETEVLAEATALYDELFPEQAAIKEFEKRLALVNSELWKTTFGAPAAAAAVDELYLAFKKASDPDFDPLAAWTDAELEGGVPDLTDPIFGTTGVEQEMDENVGLLLDQLDIMDTETTKVTRNMAEAWGEMAADAVRSMKDMVTAFKSGDIMGGILTLLETILRAAQALRSMGVIGGGAASAPAPAGARSGFGGFRAQGGPVVPGKSYVVGENGPEWFSSKKRGYINPEREAAPTRIVVVPSPYFDTVVDHRAASIAAPMAGQAAIIGVTGSEARMVRRSRRNLLAA